MKSATITEIKNQLSSYLDRVKHGETVVITERGRPIARIDSMIKESGEDAEGRLARLERVGLIHRGKRPGATKVEPLSLPSGKKKNSLLQAVLEERKEGR